MARGKQLEPETVYKIMASYAVTGNYSATARQLDMPRKTVENTVKRNAKKKEFAEVRQQKKEELKAASDKCKEEFADKCTGIIDNIVVAIDMKIKKILSDPDALDKTKLTELATSLAIVYDKRALALGDSTVNVTFDLSGEVREYAE